MQYIQVFTMIGGIVLGFLVGALLIILIFYLKNSADSNHKIKVLDKRKKKQEKEEAKRARELEKEKRAAKILEERQKREEQLEKSPKDTEAEELPSHRSLKKIFARKDENSWTQFNCDVDDKDADTYIKKSRTKQNAAYKYAKTNTEG